MPSQFELPLKWPGGSRQLEREHADFARMPTSAVRQRSEPGSDRVDLLEDGHTIRFSGAPIPEIRVSPPEILGRQTEIRGRPADIRGRHREIRRRPRQNPQRAGSNRLSTHTRDLQSFFARFVGGMWQIGGWKRHFATARMGSCWLPRGCKLVSCHLSGPQPFEPDGSTFARSVRREGVRDNNTRKTAGGRPQLA